MSGNKELLTPRDKYHDHKYRAARRSIAFLMTFEEWWKIWLDSWHLLKRGCRRGDYVMARYGDKGAYEVGNVRICKVEENRAEICPNAQRAAMRGNAYALGHKHSAEVRAKIAAAARGNNHFLERKHSAE